MPRSYQTRPSRNLSTRIREGARRLRPLFERRTGGQRKPVRRISCNLATVLNISPGGMRVRSTRRLEGVHELEVWDRSTQASVRVEVVWSRKLAFRRYEIGLRFLELSAENRSRIEQLVEAEASKTPR